MDGDGLGRAGGEGGGVKKGHQHELCMSGLRGRGCHSNRPGYFFPGSHWASSVRSDSPKRGKMKEREGEREIERERDTERGKRE